MRNHRPSQTSPGSRFGRNYFTDAAVRNFRKIVEIVGVNDVAALFLFGLGVVASVLLHAIDGDRLLGLFILFAILLFYYRMSATKVRMAQIKNEERLLKLAEEDTSPQLQLPIANPPQEAHPEHREKDL